MLDHPHPHGEESAPLLPKQINSETEYAQRLPLLKASDPESSSNSETSSESGAGEVEKSGDDLSEPTSGNKRSRSQSATGTRNSGATKRARTLLTPEQSRVLHELLQQTCFPSTQVREAVAAKLGLSPRKVQVFFQNKRQKQRKKTNGAPMASHSLVVPVYSSKLSREGRADDQYPTDLSQATYAPSSAASLEAPQPNRRQPTPASVVDSRSQRTMSRSPEHWPHGWSQRMVNTDRRIHPVPCRYASESRHKFDTPVRGLQSHAPLALADIYTANAPAAKSSITVADSTLLPPILANAEDTKPARLQLPSIDELIAKIPGH